MVRLFCCALIFSLSHQVLALPALDAKDRYGDGVHAYFDGRAEDAIQHLNEAIEEGSRDPRAYYFRGLAQLELGDEKAALEDFKAGAILEATSTGRFFPVNRSLQRVQGVPRLAIESAREAAKAEILANAPVGNLRPDGTVIQPPIIRRRSSSDGAGQLNFPDVSEKIDAMTPFEWNEPIIMEVRKPDPVQEPLEQPVSPFEAPAQTTDPPAESGNPFDVDKKDDKSSNPFEKKDGN